VHYEYTSKNGYEEHNLYLISWHLEYYKGSRDLKLRLRFGQHSTLKVYVMWVALGKFDVSPEVLTKDNPPFAVVPHSKAHRLLVMMGHGSISCSRAHRGLKKAMKNKLFSARVFTQAGSSDLKIKPETIKSVVPKVWQKPHPDDIDGVPF
jgi:hypothetical protein